MIKYAQIIDEQTKKVDVALGTDTEYYKSVGMTQMDVEQAYDSQWYLTGYAPEKPEPTIQEQIEELESQITSRNLRCAIFGDEFAIDKIAQIEAQIDELRKQL